MMGGVKMEKKNCDDECLSSVRNIAKGNNREKEFTLKEIKVDFEKRGVKNYADRTIKQSLLCLYYQGALKRPYHNPNVYKMDLMGFPDEKGARREINRRLKEIEKRLKSIELKSNSEKS